MNNQLETFSITVATNGNRFVGPAYKELKLPKGNQTAIIAPAVQINTNDVKKAIQLYREGKQEEVNNLLSKYF